MRWAVVVCALVSSGCFIEIDEVRGAGGVGSGGAGVGSGGGSAACAVPCPSGTSCVDGRCHVESMPDTCAGAIDVTQGGLFEWDGIGKPPLVGHSCGRIQNEAMLPLRLGTSQNGYGFSIVVDREGYYLSVPCGGETPGMCCGFTTLSSGTIRVTVMGGSDAKLIPPEPGQPVFFEVRELDTPESISCL